MKWYTGPDGQQRLWFDQDEIEETMEGELRKAALLPTLNNPTVDIEKFLERHLRVDLDQYAYMDRDILGATQFVAGRRPQVRINRDLTATACDSVTAGPGLLGRWRATLAHEGAHVVLHRWLFELDPTSPIGLVRPLQQSMVSCIQREVAFGGGADWREVQANRGMAATLMPRGLFTRLAREELDRVGSSSVMPEVGSAEAEFVVQRLASMFAVSRQATSIRLQTLGLVRPVTRPQTRLG